LVLSMGTAHRARRVDALDGLHHFAGVGEEAGNVFAVVGLAGDGFGGDGLFSRARHTEICWMPMSSRGAPLLSSSWRQS
jgi:hypothetical protein